MVRGGQLQTQEWDAGGQRESRGWPLTGSPSSAAAIFVGVLYFCRVFYAQSVAAVYRYSYEYPDTIFYIFNSLVLKELEN